MASNRLQIKIILVLFLIVCVVMAVSGIFQYKMTRNSLFDSLHERIQLTVERLEHALALPLWSYNLETAAGYLQAEMSNSDITALMVYESSQTFWLGYQLGNNREYRRISSSADRIIAESDTAHSHRGVITYDHEEIGSIIAYYSDRRIRDELRTQAGIIVSTAFVMGIVLSLAMGIMLNLMVARPLYGIVHQLRRASRGHYTTTDTRHAEDEIAQLEQAFDEMVTTVSTREQQLQDSITEREVLLREVHHRVKNNFQILSSLLNLQSQGVPSEVEQMFQISHNRIMSMALVHEKLYESVSLHDIDIKEYLDELIDMLKVSWDAYHMPIELKADPAHVDLDIAIPLGLVINEAVSNVFQHAFHRDDKASATMVSIEFTAGETGCIIIHDDGPGISPELFQETSDTLGVQLMYLLSKQIGGHCIIENHNGTRITITFPLDHSPR